MKANDMDDDTRGWILCAFSGIACILGASIIFIDIPVRLIPGKRHFRIQDSNAFLACSLSLSFGVMIFSALNSMLPSAMRYLTRDRWDKQKAGFLMMGCFVGGFIGIQIVSRLLHQYMPSHVVDCHHTHDELLDHDHQSKTTRGRQHSIRRISSRTASADHPDMVEVHSGTTESTPLLRTDTAHSGHVHTELVNGECEPAGEAVTYFHSNRSRPSLVEVRTRVMSFFKDTKANCDEDGPCYGYSDPCGQECLKHLGTHSALPRIATLRTATDSIMAGLAEEHEGEHDGSMTSPRHRINRVRSHERHDDPVSHADLAHTCSEDDHSEDLEAQKQQHHHHVPTNAFLSIGLQTVIAIALHKLPEGFITYATNHASRSLGFSVFAALSVHNIAEGFAMALPLYMALGSRARAVLWAALLGGLSQPLGAAVAVAWFRIARRSRLAVDSTAYACLFAVTAGIMVSVALQLFVESLSLKHNRNLSIGFAFLGMAMLGMSSCLVTE
ncbi:hypothetical protein VTK56DRAFT_9306 [Thermocarpiscus australiensis]